MIRDGLAAGLVGLAGLALAWEVAVQGCAAVLEERAPEVALSIYAKDGVALTALAAARFGRGDVTAAATFARDALAADPANVEAQRTLGLALERSGDSAAANRLMNLAGSRSWRDSATQVWLTRQRLLVGDFRGAMRHADALLRRVSTDDVAVPVFRVLSATTQEASARSALVDRLVARPDWRGRFLAWLGAEPGAGDRASLILEALRRARSGPDPAELVPYLNRRLAERQYQAALRSWQALATPAGDGSELVRDGDFSRGPDGAPFTWALPVSSGASVEIEAAPDRPNDRALSISYDGYSSSPMPRQLLVLPRGGYELSGQIRNDGDDGAERFGWYISCAEDARVLARVAAPALTPGVWTPFRGAFTVPPEGCAAQWLQLVATPGERRAAITIWYDKLVVSPRRLEQP